MKTLFLLFISFSFTVFSQVDERIPEKLFPNLNLSELTDLEFSSFYKAKQGENFIILNKNSDFKFVIDTKFNSFYKFEDLKVIISNLSEDTIIELEPFTYLNLKSEIIFSSNGYYETKNIKKKYVFTSELDEYFLDPGGFSEIPVEDYDDILKKHIFIRDNKSNFLLHEEFDMLENTFENFYEESSSYREVYYIVKKNGKFGVLSSLGKYILPTKFNKVQFVEDEMRINQPDYLRIKAVYGKGICIYNEKGEGIFQNEYLSKSEESHLYAEDMGSNYYFDGYETNYKGKKGLLQSNGHLILPPIFDGYDYFDFRNSEKITCPADLSLKSSCENYPYFQYFTGINRKTRERHFYAPNGQFLNKFEIDYISEVNKNGYVLYENANQFGLIGPGACEIIKSSSDYIQMFAGDKNIFIVANDTSAKFIGAKGEKLFKEQIYFANFLDSRHAQVGTINGVGLMDVEKSENEINWKIKPEFATLDLINDVVLNNKSIFKISLNGKEGIIDEDNKTIIEPFEGMLFFEDSYIIPYVGQKYGLMDFTKNVCLKNEYDLVKKLNNNLWKVKFQENYAIYDIAKKEFSTRFSFKSIEQIKTNMGEFFIVENEYGFGIYRSNLEHFLETNYRKIKFDNVSYEFECYKENGEKDCFFVK